MITRSRVMVQAGTGAAEGAGPGHSRRFAIGDREWLLVPHDAARDVEWRWKRVSLFRYIWTLHSERGIHLVLQEQSMFRRRWRAESVRGGWTFTTAWGGNVTVRDDEDEVVFVFHIGWLGRGRIEPASGPDLRWRRRGFRGFVLEDGEGHEVLALAPAPGFLSPDCLVRLADGARSREDLLPLVALAWQVAYRTRRQHAH